MTRPIQAGDLVCVVRGSCRCILGSFFRVGKIGTYICVCDSCSVTVPNGATAINADMNQKPTGAPIEWLLLIPPLSDPETVESHEEQPA